MLGMKMSGVYFLSIFMFVVVESSPAEPSNVQYYQRDYKILEKIAELEAKQTVLQDTISKQQSLVEYLQQQLQDAKDNEWGTWGEWSQCTWDCSGSDGGRMQQRVRRTSGGPIKEESESRACNAVQFAGCIQTSGGVDNFGVVYDYKDEIVQAACAAVLNVTGGKYVYAVRRQCSSQTVSCEDLCKGLSLICFNAFQISTQAVLQRSQTGVLGLKMYRYNSCSGNFCGPNFCCCSN